MASQTALRRAMKPLIVTLMWLVVAGGSAAAQDRPAPALEATGGLVIFADDGPVREPMAGADLRLYVQPRISVGPELVWIDGDRHSHLAVTANIWFDLLPPRQGPRRLQPFVVVGGGVFRTHEVFPSGGFTSSEGAFTAGGGVRVPAGDRFTLGVDVRVGWELHVRVNGLFGVALGD